MGRPEREKGKRGELEVRDIFRRAGFECDRTPNSGGLHIPADLALRYGGRRCGIHIESKRHERLRLKDWIDQAEADCPPGEIPVVVWRQSRMRWRADIDLETFARLMAELHQLRRRRDK